MFFPLGMHAMPRYSLESCKEPSVNQVKNEVPFHFYSSKGKIFCWGLGERSLSDLVCECWQTADILVAGNLSLLIPVTELMSDREGSRQTCQ